MSSCEIHEIKKRLIYRHMAWMYAHKGQLLIPTEWERHSEDISEKSPVDYQRKKFGVGLVDDEVTLLRLKMAY